jgi:cyclophilin family peptidyl-prolyl cis-trans isomerase
MGDFVVELMPERAPLTVANYLRYVREGYYSGTLMHRVVANFVIQGGGHSASDLKLKPVHDPVNNEAGNGLQNKRGMVGLARGESAHSGNAQFYVNLVDNPDLDPLPTRWGYAVFGRVVQGMDVVDRIGVTPTGASGPFKSDTPLKPVIIEKVEVLDGASQAASPAPAPIVTPIAAPSQDTILSPK